MNSLCKSNQLKLKNIFWYKTIASAKRDFDKEEEDTRAHEEIRKYTKKLKKKTTKKEDKKSPKKNWENLWN